MTLTLELSVNGTVRSQGRYVRWSPVPATLRVTDADGEAGPVAVTLANPVSASGGQLDFRLDEKHPLAEHLDLEVPVDGTASEFQLAGRFGHPSTSDGDAAIEVRRGAAAGATVATFPLMVRVRKDADTLTTSERDSFLRALAKLNNQGLGLYQSYRNAHEENTLDEAHGFDGFWPWHRAYLLDLERELQNIDPSVALPYWRFNEVATNLFTREFLGESDVTTQPPIQVAAPARFSPSNPLGLWSVDGRSGIFRQPSFRPATQRPHGASPTGQLRSEAVVTGFTGTYGSLRPQFEQNPHGSAHISFSGDVMLPATAPRDPLFFLLHCNVDRLWATWQWLQRRGDPTDSTAYRFQGAFGQSGSTRIGHNREDTMWPWNGVTGGPGPRPPTAPRTPFPGALTPVPDAAPTVGSMIDFQDLHGAGGSLGFDYDDVPYQPETV